MGELLSLRTYPTDYEGFIFSCALLLRSAVLFWDSTRNHWHLECALEVWKQSNLLYWYSGFHPYDHCTQLQLETLPWLQIWDPYSFNQCFISCIKRLVASGEPALQDCQDVPEERR